MRKGFEHFYRLTKEEMSALWERCTFVFDANVLLDLYRYTPDTREELLSVLTKLAPRIWIPNQVALEFHRNRLTTVAAVFEPYRKLKEQLRKLKEDALGGLAQTSGKHPFISVGAVREKISASIGIVMEELEQLAGDHPDPSSRANSDDIRDRLNELFDERTGEPFTAEELSTIHKEGADRYAKRIPPGYMDEKTKSAENKYGDFVVWKEILRFATSHKTPVVFVTGDTKEDWWEMVGSAITGPRTELRQEFRVNTGLSFHMYETSGFLKRAAEYVRDSGPQKQAAVKEIQEVNFDRRTLDEALQALRADLSSAWSPVAEAQAKLLASTLDMRSQLKMAEMESLQAAVAGYSRDILENIDRNAVAEYIRQQEAFKEQLREHSLKQLRNEALWNLSRVGNLDLLRASLEASGNSGHKDIPQARESSGADETDSRTATEEDEK